jgi:hypothetical protein
MQRFKATKISDAQKLRLIGVFRYHTDVQSSFVRWLKRLHALDLRYGQAQENVLIYRVFLKTF